MREVNSKKFGELLNEYVERKEAIIERLNIVYADIEETRNRLLDSRYNKEFYSAICDIEGDVTNLLYEIKEYKTLHNKEVKL